MDREIVSRYGVYRDLTQSPYEYKSPYGDSFKFRSQKKLDIYTRDINKELERTTKFVNRVDPNGTLPKEIVQLLYRVTHQTLYERIEG